MDHLFTEAELVQFARDRLTDFKMGLYIEISRRCPNDVRSLNRVELLNMLQKVFDLWHDAVDKEPYIRLLKKSREITAREGHE